MSRKKDLESDTRRITLKNTAWTVLDELGSYVGLKGHQLAAQIVNVNIIQSIKPEIKKSK